MLRQSLRAVARAKRYFAITAVMASLLFVTVAVFASISFAAFAHIPSGVVSHRYVSVGHTDGFTFGMSGAEMRRLTETPDFLTAPFRFMPAQLPATISGIAQTLQVEVFDGNYFQALAPALVIGTYPAEKTKDCGISERTWRESFASRSDIVGLAVSVAGRPVCSVTGVLKEAFIGVAPGRLPSLWMSLSTFLEAQGETTTQIAVPDFALQTGAVAPTRMPIHVLQETLIADVTGGDHSSAASKIASDIQVIEGIGIDPRARRAFVKGTLILALASIGLLFLVITALWATTSNRVIQQSHNTSIRVVLGATTSRIFQERALETLLICVTSLLIGSAVSLPTYWLIRSTEAVRPIFALIPSMPSLSSIAFASLVVTITLTIGTTLSMAICWPSHTAIESSERMTASSRQRTFRLSIAVVQFAAGLAGLFYALAAAYSLRDFFDVKVGFADKGLLVATLTNKGGSDTSTTTTNADTFLHVLLDQTQQESPQGIATFASPAPFSKTIALESWTLADGTPITGDGSAASARIVYLGAGALDILKFTRFAGRPPAQATGAGDVLINDAFAKKYFGDANVFGKELVRLAEVTPQGPQRYRVSGLVSGAHYFNPATSDPPIIFLRPQSLQQARSIVFRGVSSDQAKGAVDRALHSMTTEMELLSIASSEDLRQTLATSERQSTFLVGLEAVLAAGILVASCYLLAQGEIASRRKELAIREALGATPATLQLFAARSLVVPAAVGVVIAGGLTYATYPAIADALFNAQHLFARTSFLALAIGCSALFLAALFAARRVASQPIAAALRYT